MTFLQMEIKLAVLADDRRSTNELSTFTPWMNLST